MHLRDSTEPAAADDLAHFSARRIETARMRDHELAVVFLCRGHHPIAVFQGQGHRLLYHDMLAVFERRDRMRGVKRVRRGYVNRVQLFMLAQRGYAVESLNAKIGAILLARFFPE